MLKTHEQKPGTLVVKLCNITFNQLFRVVGERGGGGGGGGGREGGTRVDLLSSYSQEQIDKKNKPNSSG